MKTFLSLSCLFVLSLAALAEESSQWIAVLHSPEAGLEEKARACQRLGEFGGEEAVPALAALLKDPLLNAYARAGLERISGGKSRAALREALATCEGAPLIGIIESLGALGVTEAIDDLTRLISHKDAGVAGAALRSLGRMGPGTAPILLARLKDPSAELRDSAAAACLLSVEGRQPDGDLEAKKQIYDAILNADVPRQKHLAALRGAILARQSVPFLMEQLRSEDDDVQDLAFLALRSFPRPGLAEALQAELNSAEGLRRIRLVEALRDCGGAGTVGVLIDQLAGTEGDLRLSMIRALGQLGGAEAAAALLDHTGEEAAADALARMKGNDIDGLIVDRLKTAADAGRRLELIALLGDRRARSALKILMEQAREDDAEIRKAALRALRPLAGLSQVPDLVALSKTSDDETESYALNALVSACRQSDPPEPAGDLVLSELESAAKPDARRTWMGVLTAIGHAPALPVIGEDLGSGDEETVKAAIDLLGRWPDPAPVGALIDVGQKPGFRAAALRSILTLIGRSQDAAERLAWLKKAQPMLSSAGEKQQFVRQLGSTFDKGSLELLAPYLKDQEVREEALAARKSLNRSLK